MTGAARLGSAGPVAAPLLLAGFRGLRAGEPSRRGGWSPVEGVQLLALAQPSPARLSRLADPGFPLVIKPKSSRKLFPESCKLVQQTAR